MPWHLLHSPRTWVVAALVAVPLAGGWSPPTTRNAGANQPSALAATVRGQVFDSLGRKPLVGALVQLVATDSLSTFGRTVSADSLGSFEIREVPDGKYAIGFYHPLLDSLGIEPPLRAVTVGAADDVRVDLATPGPQRLRASVCGPATAENSGAMVYGIVRDARSGAPLPAATVASEWVEYTLAKGSVSRRSPRRTFTTRENGWYAVCNAPTPGSMTLLANREADSTDAVELRLATEIVARRDLYIGAATSRIVVDSARRDVVRANNTVAKDSLVLQRRRLHTGDGRLSGTVVRSAGGLPLVGAIVSMSNGPQARTNQRGEWTILNAPNGTRTLEVRAVGHYPERLAVDVVANAPPLRTTLSTLTAVLDTMRVSAAPNLYNAFREFQERRRSGMGRFIGADDIVRLRPVITTELFRNVLGLYYDGNGAEEVIYMKGTFDERCIPAVYINGNLMNGLVVTDIDALVPPALVEGIEIYSPTQVPPQFQQGLNGCGSIVIWKRGA